jgi:hypothetical protein
MRQKPQPTRESPNAVSGFWRQRCAHENSHQYASTVKGLLLGKIDSIPLTDKFAQNITKAHTNDPVLVASTLKQQFYDRKERNPHKVFGR